MGLVLSPTLGAPAENECRGPGFDQNRGFGHIPACWLSGNSDSEWKSTFVRRLSKRFIEPGAVAALAEKTLLWDEILD